MFLRAFLPTWIPSAPSFRCMKPPRLPAHQDLTPPSPSSPGGGAQLIPPLFLRLMKTHSAAAALHTEQVGQGQPPSHAHLASICIRSVRQPEWKG